MPAPSNPYRDVEIRGAEADHYFGVARPPSLPPPPERGHGLTAEDLNAIAINAHRRGYHVGRAEMQAAANEARDGRADAYDEGFDAGSDALVREFARDIDRRLLAEVHFPLMEASRGPKTRMQGGFELAHAALDRLRRWLSDVGAGREPGL